MIMSPEPVEGGFEILHRLRQAQPDTSTKQPTNINRK